MLANPIKRSKVAYEKDLSMVVRAVIAGLAMFAGVAIVLFVFNAFLPYSESLAGLAKATPFYYYLTSDPLLNGMHWGHGAVLAGLFVVLIAASVFLFQRRDLRQTG